MSPGRKLFLSLAMILAAAWVYWPVLHGEFIWDDKTEIPKLAALAGPGGFARIWTTPSTGDYYPVKTTVEWLQWRWWGGDTFGYHLTNVALHVIGALLLWQLLRMLGVRCARFGALLFVVHPLAVESVAWIDELKNTLSLPFLLLAMIAYVKFDEGRSLPAAPGAATAPRGATSDRWYWLSLAAFLLALLSKSSVVMFPPFLLLYAWWRRGRIRAADLRAAAPFFLASLVLGLLAIRFQEEYGLAGGVIALGGIPTRFARAGLLAAFYLGKCVFPAGLMPIYPRWSIVALSPLALLPWLGLGALLGWCWSRRTTWGRHVLLGLGWFLLNLVPVLGFVAISHMRFTWAMDHLAYVSLAGFCGLAAAGLGALDIRWARPRPAWRWIALGGAAALCALLAAASHRYAAVFSSDGELWSYEVERDPAAWLAHNNLGEALFERGLVPQAAAEYEESLRLAPDYVYTHLNLANALARMGRWSEAIAEVRAALRLQPDWAVTNKTLGDMLSRTGHPDEAIPAYERALQTNPDSPQAENGLGSALFRTGDMPGALAHFEAAVRLKPDFAEAQNNLGVILAGAGRRFDAILHFEAAVRINPNYAEARANLEAARQGP